jgi:hypothetical protein
VQALKGLWREADGFSIDIYPLRGIEMRNFIVHPHSSRKSKKSQFRLIRLCLN